MQQITVDINASHTIKNIKNANVDMIIPRSSHDLHDSTIFSALNDDFTGCCKIWCDDKVLVQYVIRNGVLLEKFNFCNYIGNPKPSHYMSIPNVICLIGIGMIIGAAIGVKIKN
jgi:hypothetical protein